MGMITEHWADDCSGEEGKLIKCDRCLNWDSPISLYSGTSQSTIDGVKNKHCFVFVCRNADTEKTGNVTLCSTCGARWLYRTTAGKYL